MAVSLEQIKELREEIGASIIECKKALEEAKGDKKKAIEALKARGIEKAAKKSSREAKQGLIDAYIHTNGKIGVILELNCETDFVARNQAFKDLAHDLSMHIAALDPKDKDELLSQAFIKDAQKTIKDLIAENVMKLGENIQIGRFSRLEI